jgi:2-iminobutanoate/2-iminopropanoate deaminase
MKKEVVSSPSLPPAAGPYSAAIRVGDLVYTAGQVGVDPATNDLVPGGVAEQAAQALRNLAAVLEVAGTSLAHAVKTTVFLVDMADFLALNAAYAGFFPLNPPARTTVAVAALPRNARVEIEVVAVIGD